MMLSMLLVVPILSWHYPTEQRKKPDSSNEWSLLTDYSTPELAAAATFDKADENADNKCVPVCLFCR